MPTSKIPKSAPILKVKDWPSFFKIIRSRPAMYLREPSITALDHLIGGIKYAEIFHRIPEDKILKGFQFEKFEAWVAERFNKNHSMISSFTLAKRKAKSEKRGFNLWFSWYDQYTRQDI